MATLTVTESTIYTGVDLTDTTQIVFDTTLSGVAATFSASQFGGGQISETVDIIGDDTNFAQISVVSIDGAFSAAGWTLSGTPVLIFMVGSDGTDTVNGSPLTVNALRGDGGADVLTGGPFGDSFVYGDPLDVVPGETLFGGAGVDSLQIASVGGSFDFTTAALSGIERITFLSAFSPAPTTVNVTGAQVAAGIDSVFNGSSVPVTLSVVGNAVDLSSLSFFNWNAAIDTVTIDGTASVDDLVGSTQPDVLSGLAGNDKLDGGGANDILNGGAGNDTLDGGAGADTMAGGAGDDTYFVDNTADKVIEAAGEGTDHVVASVAFKLGPNIERLTLIGASAVDATGDSGDNVIVGNDGANRINGGLGKDTLTGKLGPDTFAFDAAIRPKKTAKANADLITDFIPKDDAIELAASVFTKLKPGALKKTAFDSGKKKPAKDKHLVYYHEKAGDLWYDVNGKKKGGKGDVLVATLDKGLDLSHHDIVVA